MKSRGVYETPGGTILRTAHMDLEGICVDREVLALRDSVGTAQPPCVCVRWFTVPAQLSPQFAKLCYNGFWYSPEMVCVCEKRAPVDRSRRSLAPPGLRAQRCRQGAGVG